jgi:hypothetical protein
MRARLAALLVTLALLGCGEAPPNPDDVAKHLREGAQECNRRIESAVSDSAWVKAFFARHRAAITAQLESVTQAANGEILNFRSGGDSLRITGVQHCGQSIDSFGYSLHSGVHDLNLFDDTGEIPCAGPPNFASTFSVSVDDDFYRLRSVEKYTDYWWGTVFTGFECKAGDISVEFTIDFGYTSIDAEWLKVKTSVADYVAFARTTNSPGASDSSANRGYHGELCTSGVCSGVTDMEAGGFMPDSLVPKGHPATPMPSWLGDMLTGIAEVGY